MKEKKIIITQQSIIKYINNDLLDKELTALNLLRNDDPSAELLLGMIDLCKIKTRGRVTATAAASRSDFVLIEAFLPELLSGSCSAGNAHLFLSALRNSPDFFTRLLQKLDTIKNVLATDYKTAPDSAFVSDAEMFTLVKETARKSRQSGLSLIPLYLKKIKKAVVDLNPSPGIMRLAFASLLLICILGGGYIFLNTGRNVNTVYNSYFNKQNPPFMFTDSSLRGNAKVTQTNPVLDNLVIEFKMGISHYLSRDYEQALQFFNRVLVVIASQQSKLTDEQSRRLLRESYFYAGVSSMALAGEKAGNKEQLFQQAIVYLNSATTLLKNFNMKGGDRELFFKSLAYSQVGENELAMQAMNSIPDHSSFTNDCEKLFLYLNSQNKKP